MGAAEESSSVLSRFVFLHWLGYWVGKGFRAQRTGVGPAHTAFWEIAMWVRGITASPSPQMRYLPSHWVARQTAPKAVRFLLSIWS